MAVTVIDPKPALVVIDLQKGILAYPTAHPVDEIVARAADLARAFRANGWPVVLVNVAGRAPGRIEAVAPQRAPQPDAADLADELDAQPGDHRVTKTTWGAFQDTSLDAHLRAAEATQIVLCGVATSIGVESTARAAHELGYHVVLATDAMTDMDAEAHRHSVAKIFPRLGETGTTQEILQLLN